MDAESAIAVQQRSIVERVIGDGLGNNLLSVHKTVGVTRSIGIYGDSTVAIGRILSKVHVKKLFRHAVSAEEAVDALAGARGETEFHLSGLQQ